jgi:hypothetical protein
VIQAQSGLSGRGWPNYEREGRSAPRPQNKTSVFPMQLRTEKNILRRTVGVDTAALGFLSTAHPQRTYAPHEKPDS